MIARSYASDIFNMPIVVTRFCNIFGPGQLNFSALIPDAIRSALGYYEFIPRGNGNQERDFMYVQDVVELYLCIGSSLALNPKKYFQTKKAGKESKCDVSETVWKDQMLHKKNV